MQLEVPPRTSINCVVLFKLYYDSHQVIWLLYHVCPHGALESSQVERKKKKQKQAGWNEIHPSN